MDKTDKHDDFSESRGSLKELLDSVRKIEGFPIGEDEDILALSAPPYYTACPNPYLNDFIMKYGKAYDKKNDHYEKTPIVGDVKEGKTDSLSLAHEYVTKVPYKAIIRFIMHYTYPGDIIFDGFAGSGMTGLAAQLCEDGNRKAILNELSPYASFISSNYNFSVNPDETKQFADEILKQTKEECIWMYQTNHDRYGKKGEINHIIWSEIFACPYCKNEYVLWDQAVDFKKGEIKEKYHCPSCNSLISQGECEKAQETYYDSILMKDSFRVKEKPVYIKYEMNKKSYKKIPDEDDLKLIKKINETPIPYWIPIKAMMGIGEKWGDTWRAGVHRGMTHVHHFYTSRNLYILSSLFNRIQKITNRDLRNKLLFIFTSQLLRSSKKAVLSIGYFFHGGGGYVCTISGNWYIPSFRIETCVLDNFANRIKKTNAVNLFDMLKKDNIRVSTCSSTDLCIIPS